VYVSLKDVATRAGVSFQTASKVLNHQRGVVSEATRERILDAARELGYVPNALARGLVNQSSLTMGVLADEFADTALAQFVTAAHRWAGAHGQAALTVNVEPGADPATPIRILHEHRVGGILVVAPSLEADPRLWPALRTSLPAVSLNHVPGGGVPLVGSDHSETGALAAGHLVELGHRDIGTVIGPRGRRVVTSRLKGFRARLQQSGVPLPARRVVEADWTAEGGYTGACALLDADPDVTAIFVHNDGMAVGVLRALAERGRRVPDACSLVGCDDLPFAAFLNPPLTTVHVPFTETGERAADLLMRSMRGEKIPRVELLPTHLVVRDSTCPPGQTRPSPSRLGAVPR
jgi:LacI family transcriptional regulator